MTHSDAAVEVNFDGLIGPTHNYAGLAPGNLASAAHRSETSNPRAAARQGLAKMQRLQQLGVPQALLPPQARPNLTLLRGLGFSGDDAQVLQASSKTAPHLLAIACSGSSMWTANAATVCPSADAADGRVHFTPANLATSLHRSSEASATAKFLQRIFHDKRFFVYHAAIPTSAETGDEGAANHTRFCDAFHNPGVQLFVYGDDRGGDARSRPRRFASRQSKTASQAIARLHQLNPRRVVFARQHPEAIDAGVFHNDVIAVGHRQLLFCHRRAFVDQEQVFAELRQASDGAIEIVEVRENQLSLDDAVSTYLFNSQIVSTDDHRSVLVAPEDCRHHAGVKALIEELLDRGTFGAVEFVDVRQSMKNGGGPACLRLRVVLTPRQFESIHPGVLLSESLTTRLEAWIDRHYRESLSPNDLADPLLLRESRDALDELTKILRIGEIYEFQH